MISRHTKEKYLLLTSLPFPQATSAYPMLPIGAVANRYQHSRLIQGQSCLALIPLHAPVGSPSYAHPPAEPHEEQSIFAQCERLPACSEPQPRSSMRFRLSKNPSVVG